MSQNLVYLHSLSFLDVMFTNLLSFSFVLRSFVLASILFNNIKANLFLFFNLLCWVFLLFPFIHYLNFCAPSSVFPWSFYHKIFISKIYFVSISDWILLIFYFSWSSWENGMKKYTLESDCLGFNHWSSCFFHASAYVSVKKELRNHGVVINCRFSLKIQFVL